MAHLFVSHGTLWQAHAGDPAWPALTQWMSLQPKPAGIVVISAHWICQQVTLTSDAILPNIEEGFPPPLNQIRHNPPGADWLTTGLSKALTVGALAPRIETGRGLDHGSVIALRALDPDAVIPTAQLSLVHDLDPETHIRIGMALRALPSDVMVVCSGGLVHNRQHIAPMTGRSLQPDQWALDFDASARAIVTSSIGTERNNKLTELAHSTPFLQSHPTPEHFTPLFVVAALGGEAVEVTSGFQWRNLSMTSFAFAHHTQVT
jgi:4,5-DOPA dioxygenase extradiol